MDFSISGGSDLCAVHISYCVGVWVIPGVAFGWLLQEEHLVTCCDVVWAYITFVVLVVFLLGFGCSVLMLELGVMYWLLEFWQPCVIGSSEEHFCRWSSS